MSEGVWAATGTIVAALVAAFVAVIQAIPTWRQANKRPFLQKQLEVCFQVQDVAARLASEVNPEEWEKARSEFWRLYWGALCLVESPDVEAAMVNLGQLVPREKVLNPTLPMTILQRPSYELAHAARDLILGCWEAKLGEVTDARLSNIK
jgi:hypothetical protein